MNTTEIVVDENENPDTFEGKFAAYLDDVRCAEGFTDGEITALQYGFYRGADALLELLEGMRPTQSGASMAHSVARTSELQQDIREFLIAAEEVADDVVLQAIPPAQ